MASLARRIDPQTIPADLRRAALCSELEGTRAAFHALLDRVSASRWHETCPSSAWSVGEMFVHLTWALEYLPKEVEAARHKQGMFNYPRRLSDTISYWTIRWMARTATPASIRKRYDRAMDASIRMLDEVPAGEWAVGANFYGEGFYSVEELFHTPARHFAEHTAGL